MHLLFDGQSLQSHSSRGRGIGRFAYNLLGGIRQARPDWRVTFVESGHLDPADRTTLPGGLDFAVFHAPRQVVPGDRHTRWVNDRCYADWLLARGADAVLSVSSFEGDIVYPLFAGRRMPSFTVLHDLIPVLFHERCLGAPAWTEAYADRLRQMCQSDVLLANSRCSARDYRRLIPEGPAEVVTIGGATDPAFRPLTAAELASLEPRVRARFGLRGDFVLNGGGDCWRKNMRGALRAFAGLPAGYRRGLDFVVACKISEHDRRDLTRLAREWGVADALRLTGFVTDQELRCLYHLCRVFMFPSYYEGLGLPVVEALRCGAPVVTSNCSSLPEYAGPVSFLADPLEPDSVTAALEAALEEPRHAREAERVAFAERFCWRESAEQACRAIEEVVRQWAFAPRAPRPRLAWVSPLPPAPSAAADYSADLLEELARHFTVELVVGPDHPGVAPELSCRFPVIRAADVAERDRWCPYDLFVYHLADDPAHAYALPLMRRHPGAVILHGARLGGLARAAMGAGDWPVPLETELREEGVGYLIGRLAEGRVTPEQIFRLVPFTRRLLRGAELVVAPTETDRLAVRGLAAGPVVCVPPPVPTPRTTGPVGFDRHRLGVPPDRYLLCAPAPAHPGARPSALIEALAGLPDDLRRQTSLTLVGDLPDADRAELTRLAASRGVGDRLHLAGRVSAEEYPVYAAIADVCVFLAPARAGAPADLLRAMAAGAACVAAGHGAVAELPDGAVHKLCPEGREQPGLVDALAGLLRDTGRRHALRRAAREYVRARHEPGGVARRLAALFGEVIDRLRGRPPAVQRRAA